MKTAQILPLPAPGEGAHPDTRELLARSQLLQVELAQTNNRLRSLEEQLNSSEQLASFGHFKIDASGRYAFSRSASQLLGLEQSARSLEGAFAHTPPEQRQRLEVLLERLHETGAQVDLEMCFEIPGAGTRWLRVVVRRTQGTDEDLYGLIIDTTETRREQARRDVALHVSHALLQDVDSQAAYEAVLRNVCNALGWDTGSCWLVTPEGKLRCLAVWHQAEASLEALAAQQRGRVLSPGEGMVGAVLQSRNAVWVDDAQADPRFAAPDLVHSAGMRSAYTFPTVVEGGQCVGVLQFLSRQQRRYDGDLPAISGLIGALMAQRVRRESWISRLREVAERDALTGLFTRYALVERLWELTASLDHAQFALCVFDLNRFKLINDGLGHEAGDVVLKTIVGRVARGLPTGVCLARISGDEFAVIIPGGDTEVEAASAAITRAAEEIINLNGYEFSLTASLGVARFPQDGAEPETLIREADAVRHRAKRQSRSAPPVQMEAARHHPLNQIQTEHELRRALQQGELLVHYQPIIQLGDRSTVGAEALLRWQHPERGLLLPGSFLGIAEEAGLTREISRYVLACTTRDMARAGSALASDFRINVNLSALDFRDLKLFKDLGGMLRGAGITPQRLRLEVTESMLMEDVGNAERIVGLLADYGVEFAIDDFGTGYSSLAQLSRLPVHELKIDHTFTQSVDTKRGKAVVRAVLDLAARLEMPVTAEGIETQVQAVTLTAYGCNKAQGYLYARAMPFDKLLAFMHPVPEPGAA
jgi:diguanylate cyclase (GGDEF)-like protein